MSIPLGHGMARIARVVGPGIPHHITQRGNRRQQTFFSEDDFREYLSLMGEWCSRYAIEVLGRRVSLFLFESMG